MERRLVAAVASALALHAAFVAVGVRCVADRTFVVSLPADPIEIDVMRSMAPAEAIPPVSSNEIAPPTSNDSVSTPPLARLDGASSKAATRLGGAEGLVVEATAPESGVGETTADDAAPSASGEAPRRPIDLGLDGAMVARALRDTSPRAPARRRAVAFDGWSEGIVRAVAHTAAPSEGSALLTLEWDANGQLASIRSSAASSHSSAWQKLAESLKSQLARRPQASNRGLRLVYLVKSEVVKPGQRSKLTESRHVSGEQLRDEHLPPAVSFNVGVKADTSAAGQRTVSVMLAGSQVL